MFFQVVETMKKSSLVLFTLQLCLLISFVSCRRGVVFDVDGTLTRDNIFLILPFFPPHDGAADAVKAYRDLGYHIVLVTARPWWMGWFTWKWLEFWRFPVGDIELYTAPRLYLADDKTINYKRQILLDIEEDQSIDFTYGYGDSTTDFDAFAEAGVENVFALKRSITESDCKPGDYLDCLKNFNDEDHLEYIRALSPC